MTIQLREYQTEALGIIREREQRGVLKQLVVLPTGTGKTILFAYLTLGKNQQTIILVHREELVSQAVEKLQIVSPGLDVGVVKAERDETNHQVVVGSVQTLVRPSRLDRLRGNTGLIVIDEAHHGVADSYRSIVQGLCERSTVSPLIVGFTATPTRGDNVALGYMFDEIVYERTILEMMRAGYLCDLRGLEVVVPIDMANLHVRAGDYIDTEVADLLSLANAEQIIVDQWLEHASDRKTVAFAPTVAFSMSLQRQFRSRGVAAEHVDAGTPSDVRKAILQRFHTGETQVVTNVGILTEGYDEETIRCVLISRQTKAHGLYTQMVGRGTRISPGKTDCLIMDVVGTKSRADLMRIGSLTGADLSKLRRGLSVTEALDEQERELAAQALRMGEGQGVARSFVFGEQGEEPRFRPMPVDRRGFNWLLIDGRYILSAGKAVYTVSPLLLGDRYSVTRRLSRANAAPEFTILADELDLGYAQGVVEDDARRYGGELILRDLPWRAQPATEKQLDVLRKERVPFLATITRGEASDLITELQARATYGGYRRGKR